jgi:hypothetical protein
VAGTLAQNPMLLRLHGGMQMILPRAQRTKPVAPATQC